MRRLAHTLAFNNVKYGRENRTQSWFATIEHKHNFRHKSLLWCWSLTAQFLIPVPHFNLNRDFVLMVSNKEESERAMSLKCYLEIELIRRLIGGSNEQKVTLTHILVLSTLSPVLDANKALPKTITSQLLVS